MTGKLIDLKSTSFMSFPSRKLMTQYWNLFSAGDVIIYVIFY